MIIYTQSNEEMMFGEPPTPAHYYSGISNFADILDDMMNGKIPYNTGSAFPVIWKSDMDPNGVPWNDRPFTPINGDPSIFNL